MGENSDVTRVEYYLRNITKYRLFSRNLVNSKKYVTSLIASVVVVTVSERIFAAMDKRRTGPTVLVGRPIDRPQISWGPRRVCVTTFRHRWKVVTSAHCTLGRCHFPWVGVGTSKKNRNLKQKETSMCSSIIRVIPMIWYPENHHY